MTASVSLGISIENRTSKLGGRRVWIGTSQDGRICGCFSGAESIACLSTLSFCRERDSSLGGGGHQIGMESQTVPPSKGNK